MLGIIPFVTPTYHEAISELYKTAKIPEGNAKTLANVLYENNSAYYILFSLPEKTVRADVVEFIDTPASATPSSQ